MASEKYEVLLDVAKCKLAEQLEEYTAMDTRASIILAAAGVLMTALLDNGMLTSKSCGVQLAAKASFLLLCLSVVVGMLTLWVKRFEGMSLLGVLGEIAEQKDKTYDLIREFYLAASKACQINEEKLVDKDSGLRISSASLAIAALILFVLVLIE